jgi:hypothetical protein
MARWSGRFWRKRRKKRGTTKHTKGHERKTVWFGLRRCFSAAFVSPGLVWTAAVLLRRFGLVWFGLRRCFSAAFVSPGLVWTAAVLLRRFCFSWSGLDCDGASPPLLFLGSRKPKAAEKHRRSPDQTKNRPDQSGGEAPPQSRPKTDQSGGEAPPQSRPDQKQTRPKRRPVCRLRLGGAPAWGQTSRSVLYRQKTDREVYLPRSGGVA